MLKHVRRSTRARHTTHDPPPTTQNARRTTHDARRTTHDPWRTTHPPTPISQCQLIASPISNTLPFLETFCSLSFVSRSNLYYFLKGFFDLPFIITVLPVLKLSRCYSSTSFVCNESQSGQPTAVGRNAWRIEPLGTSAWDRGYPRSSLRKNWLSHSYIDKIQASQTHVTTFIVLVGVALQTTVEIDVLQE